jgi:hypothetical protein
MASHAANRTRRPQIPHIHFAAQIPHLEELKQNDTSFNRTGVAQTQISARENGQPF